MSHCLYNNSSFEVQVPDFVIDRATDDPIESSLIISESEKRWSYQVNAELFLAQKKVGAIYFDVPKDFTRKTPVVIDSVDSFHDDQYSRCGTLLVGVAAAYASGSDRRKPISLSALPAAVGFYKKLGFVLDWSQYQDADTGKVLAKTRERIQELYDSAVQGREVSQDLNLRCSRKKCEALGDKVFPFADLSNRLP